MKFLLRLLIDLEKEVRFLLYGKANRKYQIFFAVNEKSQTVQVFHVHHWAMKPLEADELQDLMDESSDAGEDI